MPSLRVFILGLGLLAILAIVLGRLRSRIRWGGRAIQKTRLRVGIFVGAAGEVAVKPVPAEEIPEEELERLVLHWFAEVLGAVFDPTWRVGLLNAASQITRGRLEPGADICKRGGLRMGWTLVDDIPAFRTEAAIDLYLVEADEGRRRINFYQDGQSSDATAVASWAILLQFATKRLSKERLRHLGRALSELVKRYQKDADPESKADREQIPNQVFLEA